jgi:hypothetical protein
MDAPQKSKQVNVLSEKRDNPVVGNERPKSGNSVSACGSRVAAQLLVLMTLNLFIGCGSGDKKATPQKMEEHRQRQIQHADRERREG